MSNAYSSQRDSAKSKSGFWEEKLEDYSFGVRSVWSNPLPEQSGPSAGVEHDSAEGKPNAILTTRVFLKLSLEKSSAFFGTRRRRPDVFLTGSLSTNKARRDKHHERSLHRSHVVKIREKTLFAAISHKKRVTMRAVMEHVLEALIGSLVVLTAEGNILLEDQHFGSRNSRQVHNRESNTLNLVVHIIRQNCSTKRSTHIKMHQCHIPRGQIQRPP